MRLLKPAFLSGPGRASAAKQLARFRSRHRPGQQVKGRIVGYQGRKMARVRIQDQEFLAYVCSNPPEGQELTFLIESLQPQVVLKEQSPGSRKVNLYI